MASAYDSNNININDMKLMNLVSRAKKNKATEDQIYKNLVRMQIE